MTVPEVSGKETQPHDMSGFWGEIAQGGDVFALAMSEYSNHPTVEQIAPNQFVLVRIDEQPAFMTNGGLPLDYGHRVVDQSRKYFGQGELMSIDYHDLDNIGNASSHGVEPFSFLFLQDNMVKVAHPDATNTTTDYQSLDGGIHTVDSVTQYLEKQEASRLLTSLLLGCQVTGVGQVLWPDHANNIDEEKRLVPADQKPIIKGTNNQSDSYSAFIEGNGAPVLVNGDSTITLLSEKLVSKNVTAVVFAGLAGNYCVLYSAESARVAQELAILTQKNPGASWEEALKNRAQARVDLGITDEQFALMFEMVRQYVDSDMTLDPKVQICVALDNTDVVRGPGGVSNPEDVEKLMQRYRSIGVTLVTM